MHIIQIREPLLEFKYSQNLEDPRDGLTLFGPLDQGKPYGIKSAVVGTRMGIERFKRWISRIQYPILGRPDDQVSRPPFPGFSAAFHIDWKPEPSIEVEIAHETLKKALAIKERHNRVYRTVDLYAKKISQANREEEIRPDIWFVVVPPELKRLCKPKSYIESELAIEDEEIISKKYALSLKTQLPIFPEDEKLAEPYYYEPNFHNQLKARLLKIGIPIQIIVEDTIAYLDEEFQNIRGKPKRDLGVMESAIAWNISTTAFYKAGGRPWKLSAIRTDVCYIGLVFKQIENDPSSCNACCAAQMFLDSGDGVVFKGNVGPWYNPKRGDYHLDHGSATELIQKALDVYSEKRGGHPKELFIHGRVRFNDEEWDGFNSVPKSCTQINGIRIADGRDLKLYGSRRGPILRGSALILNEAMAYLWTSGFIPRIRTYPGREVPNPLFVEVCRGDADISTVISDIFGLTKLNYNACIFADRQPVTLRFANMVGEILTAGPMTDETPPLPFKFYI